MSRTPMRARLALALIGLALVARLLVPAGWMPAAAPGMLVEMCSGHGAAPVWIAIADTGEDPPNSKAAQAQHDCAFAGLGLAALTGISAADLPASVSRRGESRLPDTAAAIGRGLAAPPPPATGPPARA